MVLSPAWMVWLRKSGREILQSQFALLDAERNVFCLEDNRLGTRIAHDQSRPKTGSRWSDRNKKN